MLIKLRLEYTQYLWQLVSGWRARHEYFYAGLRRRDLSEYSDLSTPQRVLDLANGRLRPQSFILSAEGNRVFGIDLINCPGKSWIEYSYRFARWLYTRRLADPAGNTQPMQLTCGDVCALPYRADTFDFVTSIAAFEHFLDVPRVVQELHRTLRPGGLAWICIHPFTCPSGGHNVTLTQIPLKTLSRDVEPWDHLRQRRLPFHVPLNQWRIRQYVQAFEVKLEVLKHYCALREGEHLLTPQVENELAMYNRDELTSHAYVILARKHR